MKAIRYLRFSHDGQSQHSIQRQDMVTSGWLSHSKVDLVDTFTDEGYSARTFDRPDMRLLMAFVKKNHRNIDYLVVAELTRFSREAGDAINMVKAIQKEYGIRIVSASRSCIYDVYDSNSFFMMGLEFLLGNSENIKRQNDINGGIYTAKTGGRWIQGGKAPFGYKKEGYGKERRLVVYEPEAQVVRFIYHSFLIGTPFYAIKDDAVKMGLTRTSRSSVQDILQNPLYTSRQYVKAWKDKPGGLYEIEGLPQIIDDYTWRKVQEKMNPGKPKMVLNDRFHLRGVLKCWCGQPVTGADSRSRSGKYIGYYNCKHKGHNYINSEKAHRTMEEIMEAMSLPERLIIAIRQQSAIKLQDRLKQNEESLVDKRKELGQVEKSLNDLEQKFITNQIQFDTYDKWNRVWREKRNLVTLSVRQLEQDHNQAHFVLGKNLDLLSNMKLLYTSASLVQKQEIVRRVFDNQLYYQNHTYRTGYIMPVFNHCIKELQQKNLLQFDVFLQQVQSSGDDRTEIEPLTEFLGFISGIAV